jgi:hypothetical protein
MPTDAAGAPVHVADDHPAVRTNSGVTRPVRNGRSMPVWRRIARPGRTTMLPVDVTERVELVSDGWIDAARRFLEDAVATVPALATGRYAVCE